jgi:sec-independent protein translocase protein TatA
VEFSPGHLLVLAIVAGILFFGWKQLPDMARSAGRSLRIFRTEIKGLADDDSIREARSALTSPLATDGAAVPTVPTAPIAGSWSGPQPQTAPLASASVETPAPDASAKPAG